MGSCYDFYKILKLLQDCNCSETAECFIAFTDKVLIKTIIEKVLMNADAQSPEVSVSLGHHSK